MATATGILWHWFTDHETEASTSATGHDRRVTSPIRRYVGIIFDEFADLEPLQEEMARLLKTLLMNERLWSGVRLVVTSAALQKELVQRVFGDLHTFVQVTDRKHTMQRCIVAPRDEDCLLDVATDLALAALSRRDAPGDVIVFLPGMSEMVTIQRKLRLARPKAVRVDASQ